MSVCVYEFCVGGEGRLMNCIIFSKTAYAAFVMCVLYFQICTCAHLKL